jgi:hypothetical protein
MIATVFSIYSKVAKDIGDVQLHSITKQEYIATADEVNHTISKDCRVYMAEMTYTVVTASHRYLIPMVATAGSIFYPIYITRLVRGTTDCREYSWNAIESSSIGESPIKVNDTAFDHRAYAIRALPNGINGSNIFELIFSTELEVDEVLTVTFAALFPLNNQGTLPWVRFDDSTVIPPFMEEAFYKLLRTEIVAKLVIHEGDKWMNRMAMCKKESDGAVSSLKSYIRNLKDTSSFPQLQPFKWLSDDNDYYSTFNGSDGIPDEYHTNNIL